MKITALPQDLNFQNSDSIQVYNYESSHDIQRSKINLTKNTISFLRKGIKEVIGDSESVHINNQQFVVMKSGNCLMTEKVINHHKTYKSTLLFFTDEAVCNFLEKYKIYSVTKPTHQSFYVFQYDNFTERFVESLDAIVTLPTETQGNIVQAKFDEIMLYLTYQHGASFLNRIAQQANNGIVRLVNVVNKNKHNKLSLQELAFLSNMSISTFKREFFKHYQQTPIKWLSDARLEYIATLLKAQHKRPIELYEEAGYENLSNFVQAFKKKFGVTPKQYQLKY